MPGVEKLHARCTANVYVYASLQLERTARILQEALMDAAASVRERKAKLTMRRGKLLSSAAIAFLRYWRSNITSISSIVQLEDYYF